ncbi:MAG: 5-formyltetrahydrofolate cyclo-ligase [Alphaproteobacteria bacterium]|nr:5-formyltetrahydrofolate cyclo-ligase [Alphaproteobacteria bacterium]MCB9795140.1 5-formyltetrahydrofolate cyclo-ligase [Alphaproteobacteria bacterium]
MPDPDDKQALREEVWESLREARVARFPGTRGRIPNFKGAEAAAVRLSELPEWQAARTLKVNPDSPQRPVRHAALKAGKRLYLPAPRLAEALPFIELDPAVLPEGSLWAASSIKGAFALGRPVGFDALPHIDLIVTGCVAVTPEGARLGKGGGYSDLEFAMLRERGLVDPEVPILTTVHPLQLVHVGRVQMTAHDISLDALVTPDAVLRCPRVFPRPTGVIEAHLSDEKAASIPVLRRSP